MSRALTGRMPRMFRSHQGQRGAWFREAYRGLEARLAGPFDAVTRQYAAGVSALWVEWRSDKLAQEEAERARQAGRGRRPSVQEIARLKKRAALSWGSYDAALRRLEELAAKRPAQSFAEAIANAGGSGPHA